MAEAAGSERKVLLLEDNPGDVQLVDRFLSNAADVTYQLSVFATQHDAVNALRSRSFDILLTDLNLPDASGVDAVVGLRQESREAPIVVFTETDDLDLAHRCIEAGAQDYLSKTNLDAVALQRAIGFASYRAQQSRVRELEEALSRYRSISSTAATTSITGSLAQAGPIKARAPGEFASLADSYSRLFDDYLRQLTSKSPKPEREMAAVVDRLGDLGAGPRDLIDLHVHALELGTRRTTSARARAYVVDGRLLATEMMGLLVDYYRLGRRPRTELKGEG
ncbi:MAG: response regulator [Myxococcota bacterium]